MAYNIKIVLAVTGGFLGWSLFFYMVYQFKMGHKKEVDLIQEIIKEIKQIKSEINKQLK